MEALGQTYNVVYDYLFEYSIEHKTGNPQSSWMQDTLHLKDNLADWHVFPILMRGRSPNFIIKVYLL